MQTSKKGFRRVYFDTLLVLILILVLKLLFMFVLTLLLVLFFCCGIASARLALVAVSLPPYVDKMLTLVLVLVLFFSDVAFARVALVAVSLPPYVEEEDFPPAASKPSSDNRHSHSQETFSIFMELCKCRYHSLKRCINIKNTYVDCIHFPCKERNYSSTDGFAPLVMPANSY